MTYETAANALVDAGLLKKTDVAAATQILAGPSVEMTYPAWARALADAGLIDQGNVEALPAEQIHRFRSGSRDSNDHIAALENGRKALQKLPFVIDDQQADSLRLIRRLFSGPLADARHGASHHPGQRLRSLWS